MSKHRMVKTPICQYLSFQNGIRGPQKHLRNVFAVGHQQMCRQDRFVGRFVKALSDPRVTHEIRSVWISYWSQACYLFILVLYFFIHDACLLLC